MFAEALITIQGVVPCSITGKRPHEGCALTDSVHGRQQQIFRMMKTMASVKSSIKHTGTIVLTGINAKGIAKIANILDSKGKPIHIILAKECTLRTPW